jgi:2-isopropylmalate synthase
MKNDIIIFDTTLRDGEQSPGFSMNLQEKLRLARQLSLLGVDVIEAGFPIASQGDFEAVRQVARSIEGCEVAALARTKKEDIDRAWEALQDAEKPRIHTFIATSDIHLKYKLNITREQAIKSAVEAVSYARERCDMVEFSAEDASRTDAAFLVDIFSAAIEAGASVINVPDTVGYAVPWEYGAMIKYLHERINGMDKAILSVHCHNDLGLAVANSLAGVLNGAVQIECTINGIGERAGNASLEEIVMALRTRQLQFGRDTKVDSEQIYPTSRMLAEITGNDVQRNKAIVGVNAFAHEAGIHQDGVIKNPLTYEIMTPESVGVPVNQLVIGKHSGRRALCKKASDLGFDCSGDALNSLYEAVTAMADRKKIVHDSDISTLCTELNIPRFDSYNTYKSA